VMLAMLFIAEQRVAHQPGLALLTPRDIVEMLKETLPRKPEGKDALVARIKCQVAEHCWDPVGHAIATYGYLFEGLIQASQREV